MNRPMLKRIFRQVSVWTALTVLCGAVALAQDGQVAAARTDGQIETDVNHALDASKALKSDLITASTMQSEVTLTGNVPTEASRELAEWIVSHVPGVTKVDNNLTVGAQPAPNAMNQPGDASVPPPDSGQAMQDIPPPPAPNMAPGQAGGGPDDQGLNDQIRSEVQSQIQAQKQAQRQALPMATGPVTIPAGTLLQLRTSEGVASKHAKDGQKVQFIVIRDVTVDGMRVIPRGAVVHGVVSEVKQAGDLKGSPELALRLTSLEMGGQSYPLESNQFKVKGTGKGGRTANNMIGGTMWGTIIGCAAGRGIGCAVGAGAGLAAGTAASAATPGPGVWIPAEARVDFHLEAPVTVNPVSAQEAARMAQGLYPGGPTLYRRYDPYGRPYSYYGYPPVYYRPYYATGDYYYWR